MARTPEGPKENVGPLLDLVLEHVPAPSIEEGPFRLLATTVESNPYLGRILTGRITSGALKPNQPIRAMSREGKVIEVGRATQVLGFRGLQRVPVDEARRVTSSPSPACRPRPSPTPSPIRRWTCRCRPSRSIRRPCR